MATEEVKKQMGVQEKEEVKWIKHYSSNHQILLVGDGDFSFSLCLALGFGSASNICATSLDSYDTVIKQYKTARLNLDTLKKLGASVHYGVDAKKMNLHPDLRMRKFDGIIFNFPHAGFYGKEDNLLLIGMHRSLVKEFFRNASVMLRAAGEVHLSHKTTAPFSNWHIEELASCSSLSLIRCSEFKIEDYPGYRNKRGDGSKCDKPFPLGECRTFIFGFFPAGKKKSEGTIFNGFFRKRSQLQEIPIQMQKQEMPFDLRYPHIKSTVGTNEFSACAKFSTTLNILNEWPRTYDGCFSNKRENFGRSGNGVGYSIDESRRLDSLRHAQASFSRTTNDLPGYMGLPVASDTQRENARIFNSHFNSVNSTFRRACNDVGFPVCESFIFSERCMVEASGIPRNARNYDGCFNNVSETPRRVGNGVGYPVHESCISSQRYMAEAPGFPRENARIYGQSFDNVNEKLRRVGPDVSYPVCESLISPKGHVAEAPGRTSNGYMYLMDELYRQRTLGSAQLHRMWLDSTHQL